MKFTSIFFLSCSAVAQSVVVAATATSFTPPPKVPTHTRVIPGEALSRCSGNISYIGDFASTNLSCSSTYTEPRTFEETSPYATVAAAAMARMQSRRTSYTIVESSDAVYLFSCYEKWKWQACPDFAIGDKLNIVRERGKLVLSAAGQPLHLRYLASIAKPSYSADAGALDDALAAMAKDMDAWKTASNCDGIKSFSKCRAQVFAGSNSLESMRSHWRQAKSAFHSQADNLSVSQACEAATSEAIATTDKYLLIQEEILGVYKSIDPASSEAKSSWESGNAKFLELQQEQAALPDLVTAASTIRKECPKETAVF